MFEISEVSALRERAVAAAGDPQSDALDWIKSINDPMDVLEVFDALQIKHAYVLRAYQCVGMMGGNGFVYAMPENSDFPDPNDCPRLKDQRFEPPKPPESLDDFMEAIDGDDSPWSYLSASLVKRELTEFGAMWHGCDWSTHRILGSGPLKSDGGSASVEAPRGSPEDWLWQYDEPDEWHPTVKMDNAEVTVMFYTYSGLGRDAIYQQIDRFHRHSYRFTNETIKLAEGSSGYVF